MEIDGYEITGMYLGDQEISNAYVGDKEVFSKTPAEPLYACYYGVDMGNPAWVYAKTPLGSDYNAYIKTGSFMGETKAESSSDLGGSFLLKFKAFENQDKAIVTLDFGGAPNDFTQYRDRSADLYT